MCVVGVGLTFAAGACGGTTRSAAPVAEKAPSLLDEAVEALARMLGRSTDDVGFAVDDVAGRTGRSALEVAQEWQSVGAPVSYRTRLAAVADEFGVAYSEFKQSVTGEIVVEIACDAYDRARDDGVVRVPTHEEVFEAVENVVRSHQLGFDYGAATELASDIQRVIEARASERAALVGSVVFERVLLGCPL